MTPGIYKTALVVDVELVDTRRYTINRAGDGNRPYTRVYIHGCVFIFESLVLLVWGREYGGEVNYLEVRVDAALDSLARKKGKGIDNIGNRSPAGQVSGQTIVPYTPHELRSYVG